MLKVGGSSDQIEQSVLNMKFFGAEPILVMTFHQETELWIIVTSLSTYRIKPEVLSDLMRDGVIHG